MPRPRPKHKARRMRPYPNRNLKQGRPPKSSKQYKYDWKQIEGRFMAHEWTDYGQMSAMLQIPKSVVYKNCSGWHTKREELDDRALHQMEDRLVEDRATMILDMNKRQLAIARRLQAKAARRLLRKKLDPISGEEREVDFENDSLAIQALRLGASMEQGLLMRAMVGGDQQPGSMTFNGPAVLLAGGPAALGSMAQDDVQRRLAEFSPEALQNFLMSPDDDSEGTKKAGGPGATEPAGRAKKH